MIEILVLQHIKLTKWTLMNNNNNIKRVEYELKWENIHRLLLITGCV